MHTRPRSVRLLLPAAALSLLVTGCASADDPPAAAAPSAASTPDVAGPATPGVTATPETAAAPVTVTIADFAYEVPPSVEAGAQVQVKNEDSEAHTLTLGGGGDVQVVVQGGDTVTFTAPARAGTYPIGCDFHGDMTADLVVT